MATPLNYSTPNILPIQEISTNIPVEKLQESANDIAMNLSNIATPMTKLMPEKI